MAWPILAAMAALGIGKHFLSDKPQYEEEKKSSAESNRYAPLTGRWAKPPESPSLINSIIGAGATGMALSNEYDSNQTANAESELRSKELAERIKAMRGQAAPGAIFPWGATPGPAAAPTRSYFNFGGSRWNPALGRYE